MTQAHSLRKTLLRDGYVHVKSALDVGQVAAWHDIVLEHASQVPNRAGGLETVAMFLPDAVPKVLNDLMRAPVLGALARAALGVEKTRLFAGTAYLKPPKARGSFWHQDMWFFPLDEVAMLTIWVPLAPISADCAPMIYAKGSHKTGFVDWPEDQEPQAWPLHRLAPMEVGDVVVHDGWVLHGSAGNDSTQTRAAMGLAVFPDGARFATHAQLQTSPERWRRIAPMVDTPAYDGGVLIAGARCPLMR